MLRKCTTFRNTPKISMNWDSLNKQSDVLIGKLALIWLFMFILVIVYFFMPSIIIAVLLSFCGLVVWHISKQLNKIDEELDNIIRGGKRI